MLALGLSFVAGLLTALSPCVLPALPIVIGSAAAERRHGPLALAAGLITAFTIVGVVLASASATLGLTDAHVRRASAVMLVAAGVVLLSPRLQNALSRRLTPLASAAATSSTKAGSGLGGQFFVGAMLGGVWSPCVGPTLGAAVSLAAGAWTDGGGLASLARATAMMFAFGVGSAAPLVATAYGSRRVLAHRGALLSASATGKRLFAVALVTMGIAVFAGLDKVVEAAFLDHLPGWWVSLIAGV
jgi:cytochrome c biogenesis protein CcdA